jgi:hypothetical protein
LWVLTSAFCITNIEVGILVIKAGKHNITIDDENVQTAHIEKRFIHPKYPG